jgi:hypothetical protein
MSSVGIVASSVNILGTDVLLEPFNDLTAWTTTGSPSIVAGRTGTALRCSGATDVALYALAANANEYVTVGFAWRTNTASTSARVVCELWSGGGANAQVRLQYNGTTAQTFTAYRGAGTLNPLGTSSGATVAVNTYAYLELQVRFHDTLGSVVMRINGTTVINLTNVDTKTNADTVLDTLRITTALGSHINLWDDLYITVGAGAAFKGDITIP